jgi:hypothetical protein
MDATLDDKMVKLFEQQKKCDDLKKTIRLIQALPDDVSRHIYEEFFEAKTTCTEFLNLLLKDVRSHRLEHKHLTEITGRLIQHGCAVEYLSKHCKVFNDMYKAHYIDKKKYFLQLNVLDSFVLSMLMYLYH